METGELTTEGTEDPEDCELTTADSEGPEGGLPFTMRRMPSRRCTTLKLISKPRYLLLNLR